MHEIVFPAIESNDSNSISTSAVNGTRQYWNSQTKIIASMIQVDGSSMTYEHTDDYYTDNFGNMSVASGITTILPALNMLLTSTLSDLHNLMPNTTSVTSGYINGSQSDNDTIDTPYEEYKYRPETYMVPIIFGLIFVVGVVGNGTLIIVFIKHRAMRNVPNT